MENEIERIQRQRAGTRKRWLYTFAGQAMQGYLGSMAHPEMARGNPMEWKIISIGCVDGAQALLNELEKREADNAKKS